MDADDVNNEPAIQVGAKVRLANWTGGNHIEVTAIGRSYLLGVGRGGEGPYPISLNWVRYVEPPTVVSVQNVYRGGAIGCYSNRTEADESAFPNRIAVVTVYSNGEVEVQDVRP